MTKGPIGKGGYKRENTMNLLFQKYPRRRWKPLFQTGDTAQHHDGLNWSSTRAKGRVSTRYGNLPPYCTMTCRQLRGEAPEKSTNSNDRTWDIFFSSPSKYVSLSPKRALWKFLTHRLAKTEINKNSFFQWSASFSFLLKIVPSPIQSLSAFQI